LGGISVGNGGGSSVSRGGRKGNAVGGKWGVVGFVTTFACRSEGKRKQEGMGTVVPRTAAARWRPVSAWEHRGARTEGHRGKGLRRR
jgi:hypothetical protein